LNDASRVLLDDLLDDVRTSCGKRIVAFSSDICLAELNKFPATTSFISYFESTWLNSTAYPITMWSHYSSTLSDEPRTNNYSEGSNNALNTVAGCSSPTIH